VREGNEEKGAYDRKAGEQPMGELLHAHSWCSLVQCLQKEEHKARELTAKSRE